MHGPDGVNCDNLVRMSTMLDATRPSAPPVATALAPQRRHILLSRCWAGLWLAVCAARLAARSRYATVLRHVRHARREHLRGAVFAAWKMQLRPPCTRKLPAQAQALGENFAVTQREQHSSRDADAGAVAVSSTEPAETVPGAGTGPGAPHMCQEETQQEPPRIYEEKDPQGQPKRQQKQGEQEEEEQEQRAPVDAAPRCVASSECTGVGPRSACGSGSGGCDSGSQRQPRRVTQRVRREVERWLELSRWRTAHRTLRAWCGAATAARERRHVAEAKQFVASRRRRRRRNHGAERHPSRAAAVATNPADAAASSSSFSFSCSRSSRGELSVRSARSVPGARRGAAQKTAAGPRSRGGMCRPRDHRVCSSDQITRAAAALVTANIRAGGVRTQARPHREPTEEVSATAASADCSSASIAWSDDGSTSGYGFIQGRAINRSEPTSAAGHQPLIDLIRTGDAEQKWGDESGFSSAFRSTELKARSDHERPLLPTAAGRDRSFPQQFGAAEHSGLDESFASTVTQLWAAGLGEPRPPEEPQEDEDGDYEIGMDYYDNGQCEDEAPPPESDSLLESGAAVVPTLSGSSDSRDRFLTRSRFRLPPVSMPVDRQCEQARACCPKPPPTPPPAPAIAARLSEHMFERRCAALFRAFTRWMEWLRLQACRAEQCEMVCAQRWHARLLARVVNAWKLVAARAGAQTAPSSASSMYSAAFSAVSEPNQHGVTSKRVGLGCTADDESEIIVEELDAPDDRCGSSSSHVLDEEESSIGPEMHARMQRLLAVDSSVEWDLLFDRLASDHGALTAHANVYNTAVTAPVPSAPPAKRTPTRCSSVDALLSSSSTWDEEHTAQCSALSALLSPRDTVPEEAPTQEQEVVCKKECGMDTRRVTRRLWTNQQQVPEAPSAQSRGYSEPASPPAGLSRSEAGDDVRRGATSGSGGASWAEQRDDKGGQLPDQTDDSQDDWLPGANRLEVHRVVDQQSVTLLPEVVVGDTQHRPWEAIMHARLKIEEMHGALVQLEARANHDDVHPHCTERASEVPRGCGLVVELPRDALLQVFRFLSERDVMRCCSTVSKQWRTASLEHALWVSAGKAATVDVRGMFQRVGRQALQREAVQLRMQKRINQIPAMAVLLTH